MDLIKKALTFDDILLVPSHSTVMPKNTNLKTQLTKNITLNIPIISAAMDTVTESKLAIALALEGGIGIIHKNMSIKQQANEVRSVKRFESDVINNPITITPTNNIEDVFTIQKTHNISALPVIANNKIVGLVTSRDVRFETNLKKLVKNVMTPLNKLITVHEDADIKHVISLLQKYRIERVIITNKDNQLKGMRTASDIKKSSDFPNACKDKQQRLRVGAAIDIDKSSSERVDALVQAGVDVVIVDTAHGHSQQVIDQVAKIKNTYPNLDIVAGNVVTADAALDLVKAGADCIKVGIGPGSICTTRIITGVGMPQITAIQNVANALKNSAIPLIADGGIRYSGDITKALATGAYCVMLGSMLAGTEESPGDIELFQGRSYKSYRGMGSIGAMKQTYGSSNRYFQSVDETYKHKLVPEGIEGRVPFKGSIHNIINQIIGGVRSAMGYIGCATLKQMRNESKFVQISTAGIIESHVHDVTITKESPNYRK